MRAYRLVLGVLGALCILLACVDAGAQDGRRVACVPADPAPVRTFAELPLDIAEYLRRTVPSGDGGTVPTPSGNGAETRSLKTGFVSAALDARCAQVIVRDAGGGLATYWFERDGDGWRYGGNSGTRPRPD